MPTPQPRKACSWEGCFSLSTTSFHGSPFCLHHYYRQRYLLQDRPYKQRIKAERRGKLLAAWLTRPLQRFDAHRVRDGNLPPLTKRQQRIYDRELARLIQKRPPKDQVAHAQLCSWAARYAREGGYDAYNYRRHIESRKAGWRRKWLREGTYDPKFLEGLDIPHD